MNDWDQKRKVARRYDLTAQMYDALYGKEQEAKHRVAIEGLRGSTCSLILDVGCGTGLFFTHVAGKAKLIVGMDISSKLLAKAQERAGNLCNVHLVRGDADNLPFKKHAFTVVSAFTLLQNMPKPLITLKEIRRTMKPNGLVVVTGLKRVFPLKTFEQLMKHADLSLISVRDDNSLKCYVAFGFTR